MSSFIFFLTIDFTDALFFLSDLDDSSRCFFTESHHFEFATKPAHTDVAQNWMLIANPAAWSEPHIDGGGYCTWVKPLTGSKLWYASATSRLPGADGLLPRKGGKWIEIFLNTQDEL